MKKINIFLLAITVLALILRFWNLNSVPPSPDWDEVAYGYNAYSILQTGRDEYGIKFPVVLRSYDDYKPALYSYLAIPSVAVFGLNPFSVRFPNAVFSVIGVIATYFLVRKIIKRDDIALLSSFFMAVSPWQIQFTRFSHEATVAVTINILAVLFFLIGLKKHWGLVLSAFFVGLSVYSYQSEKIFIPLLGISILTIYFKQWIKVPRKYIFAAVITFLIVVLPMLSYLHHDRNALSRAKGTSIFSHQTEVLDKSAKELIIDKQTNNLPGLVLHNRRVVYAEEIIKNYLIHFSPEWLFLKGDQPRHHPPGMGVLYLWELPFILFGILFLLRKNITSKKNKLLILAWLLIAPIPAAFTYDVPHAGRTMNLLPILQIFTALGVISFFTYLKPRLSKRALYLTVLLIGLLFFINFAYYLNQYFVNLNKQYSQDWQYGYKDAVSEIRKIEGNYKQIIVSDKVPMDQSYMFFLFYLNYPPQKYQTEYDKNHSFDRFTFRGIDWEKDSKLKNVLIVGSPKDFPDPAPKLETINYLNGQHAIIISDPNE